MSGFDFDCAGSVIEYDVYVNDKYFEHGNSPIFTDRLRTQIDTSKIKSLTFKNVKVKMCGEQIYDVVDYKLFVKDYKIESRR